MRGTNLFEHWNESSTLQLISAVQKVEDDWGVREWEDQGEKWRHIADELPINILRHLGADLQEFPDLCKTRFFMICQCFNEVFTKCTRHRCLTSKVMTALAGYSLRSDRNAYFRRIGPREHFRPILPVNNESDISFLTNIGRGRGGLAPSADEYRTSNITGVHHEVEEAIGTVAESKKDEVLFLENAEEILQDVLTASKSKGELRDSSLSGFVIKVKSWQCTGGLVSIPRIYCLKYMQKGDATFLTCIRNGKKYQIKYLPHKFCLSGGWGHFARANELNLNDELVFRRVDLSTYQVEIVGKECDKKTWRASKQLAGVPT